ncbi:MAG TPA: NB-ARC domain-containing protein, partial [Anaerolineae bacterium]|nr:NB-ARC domain-containing protein [Anaerolineae bacterium]
MSDKLISTNGAARSGGIDLNTRGDANISGDAVGRDKIVNQLIQPPSGVLALHQLPPPPPDFTGRQSDLADLLDQFQQGTTIFGIHGEGGIGKTALALKLAERLSEQYSEAQIFLDLKGSSSTPLSAYDIMAYIIRSFQPAAKLPEDKDRLTAAYRSVLFEQHTLLLLDNIRGAEQIQPLWPPSAGCGVIVTSRFHFTLPGLSSKNLTTLSTADARALLLRITPRIGERADEIAKLCGYLPLALRPVASQLKMRESLTPASCIEKLSDEPRRLKFLSSAADYSGEPSVDAALAASCDLLSERLRKLWRMVSIFPKEFDAVEAGAVWALDFET